MIIKNAATDESLDILVKGAKALNGLARMEEHASNGAFAKFKSALGQHICYVGAIVNTALVSPKASALDLDGALRYLLLFVCRSPELYGRINYYFADADYCSVNTGVNLYNLLITSLQKALEFEGFNILLLRFNPDKFVQGDGPKDEAKIGNCLVTMEVLPRAVFNTKKNVYEVKVHFDIKNIEDPEAWFGFVLVDVAAQTKSHVVGARNQGGDRMEKTYTMEVPPTSIAGHNHFEVVGIVQGRFRLSKLDKSGSTKLPTYSNEIQLRVDSYLTQIVKK